MIFAVGGTFGQNTTANPKKLLLIQQVLKPMVTTSFNLPMAPTQNTTTLPAIFLSANYYASQLGFFCKQEIKFDKITKISFRFRLGSVEECNRLEGKKQ